MEQLPLQQPGYAAAHALPPPSGANPGHGLDMNIHQNPGLRPVLDPFSLDRPVWQPAAEDGPPRMLPCCWGCRVVAGPDWDFGDQDGKAGNVGIVQRPSKKVILEWIDEWAQDGNRSGWSPYKSVVVNWGKRGDTYYYKLADDNRYDVALAPDCHGLHICGGSTEFWKVARMWDTLFEKKMQSCGMISRTSQVSPVVSGVRSEGPCFRNTTTHVVIKKTSSGFGSRPMESSAWTRIPTGSRRHPSTRSRWQTSPRGPPVLRRTRSRWQTSPRSPPVLRRWCARNQPRGGE